MSISLPTANRYSAYRSEVRANRTLTPLRSGILIVGGLYMPFLILDYFVYPEQFELLALARLCITAILAFSYWIAPQAPQLTMIFTVLAVGFNLVAVIGIAGGVSSLYYPGIMLLFLGMPVLLPLTALQSGGIVCVLFSAFALLPALGVGEFANREFFAYLFFPGAAAAESVFSCALLNRLRFVDYCRTEEIAAARDELANLDDAKTRFSANVHHELRTPLTLLLAPLEGIHAGEYGHLNERTKIIVNTMRANGRRLLKLINNLLDLAKLEDKSFTISRSPISISDILNELVDGTRALAEQKNVNIHAENLPDQTSIFADRDALEKVFMNLIGNALKFTGPGGQITISGRALDDGVQIDIADTGIGLEHEQIERIFDRFAQVDTSSTREHEGTGIGLSLALELVELHEGRLWATSPGIDRGTTMSIFLPRGELDARYEPTLLLDAEDQDPTQPTMRPTSKDTNSSIRPDEPGALTSDRFVDLDAEVRRWLDQSTESNLAQNDGDFQDSQRHKILVVDDNSDMRELLSHILGNRFDVRCARNGREALEMLETYEPLLVVTDIMMPEMNGTELCAAIKSSGRLKEIPVMIISSKAEGEMKVRGLELGANDYVTKPFHPREVMARATSLIELRVAQQEVRARNIELQDTLQELQITQGQLVQSERLAAVGEIAAGIAHEVNNPVNFALNAARALRASVSDFREITDAVSGLSWQDAEKLASDGRIVQNRIQELGVDELSSTIEELGAIVEQGLDRTQKLVGDLRDFAAPRRNSPDRNFDLCSSLKNTTQLFTHELFRAGIDFEFSASDEAIFVKGNESAINQVALNLLKNASQALESYNETPEQTDPKITLSIFVTATETIFEITDNGPGIDPTIVTRLFEPFFTTKEVGIGTGLGLSICNGIVLAHDGRMEIDTELGRGSTFRVYLPRADSQAS